MFRTLSLIALFLISVTSFSQCEDFDVSLFYNSPSCHNSSDGYIIATVSGGVPPVDIEFSNEAGAVFFGVEDEIESLEGDQWYFIYVEDGDGCVFDDSVYLVNPLEIEVGFEIVEPTSPDSCNGDIFIDTVYNACLYEGFDCFWPDYPELDSCELVDVCPGTYTLIFTDICGCSVKTEAFLPGSLGNLTAEGSRIDGIGLIHNGGVFLLDQSLDEHVVVECYDVSGRQLAIQQVLAGEQVVDLDVGAGMIIYVIRGVDGEVLGSGRVM